jgi:hypothetical protein
MRELFLLMVCGTCLLVGSAFAELSSSEIEMLFAYSLQHGTLTVESPQFETSLARRDDFRRHSRREYLTFSGYLLLAGNARSLHDVCVTREDWRYKKQNVVEIDQFIICQATDNSPQDLKVHKIITEDNGGKVLKIRVAKLSSSEADSVQRTVADVFLAEANNNLASSRFGRAPLTPVPTSAEARK